MLKSMTGFGSARCEVAGYHMVVEAKAVNGRFLKTSIKLPAILAAQESVLEALIKTRLRRGSITLSVFLSRNTEDAAAAVQVNEAVARAYVDIFSRLGVSTVSVPNLPGVIGQKDRDDAPLALVEGLQHCAQRALDQLDDMRRREGEGLALLLAELCRNLERARQQVRVRAPQVVVECQQKLQQRVAALLSGVEVSLDAASLAREVALYADRSDITEEIGRLGVHLEQVAQHLQNTEDAGRTLEFLAQEMHREVNTIGAKSADSWISGQVVQMKADLERFKEQIANVQ